MTQSRQSHQAPPTGHARKRSPLPWLIFAVLVVVGGIVLVPKLFDGGAESGPEPVAAAEQDPLIVAAQKCDPTKKGAKLSDSNRTLTVNGAGEKSKTGLVESAMTCVFDTLQVPGALADRMYGTVAADGQLQGDWPGFTVVWTNDKDKGLDLTVTRN